MPKFISVAKTSDIAAGSGKCFEVEGKRIALFRIGNDFHAIDDTCPHAGASLSEGAIDGEEVECPWHGARFKIKSGQVTAPPSDEGVAKYAVRVTGDAVEVEV